MEFVGSGYPQAELAQVRNGALWRGATDIGRKQDDGWPTHSPTTQKVWVPVWLSVNG